MRDVNFYLALVLGFGLMMGTGSAYAAEPADDDEEEEILLSDDDLPVEETPLRPNLQDEFMGKPITAKKIYREAWNNDNVKGMSTLEQLEFIQKNGPKLDPDIKIIMDSGIELMKKTNYGLENIDLADKAGVIQNNPPRAIQDLSEDTDTEASVAEIMAIGEEIREPSQRLMEKIYKDKSFGRGDITVDVDSF